MKKSITRYFLLLLYVQLTVTIDCSDSFISDLFDDARHRFKREFFLIPFNAIAKIITCYQSFKQTDQKRLSVSFTRKSIKILVYQRHLLLEICKPSDMNNASLTNRTHVYPACDNSPAMLNIIYIICLSIIIILNVIGNSCVIIVITMSRVLRSLTTNYFLASLAVADLLMGVISLPIKIKQSLNDQLFCMKEEVCWFYFLTDTTISISSITHLSMIAIDRYIAVAYPYRYERLMTKKRVKLLISFAWCYAVIWSGLITINWKYPNGALYGIHYEKSIATCYQQNDYYFLTIYIVNFLIPTVIMAFTYTYVYNIAIKHIKAISNSELQSSTNKKNTRRKRREFKALRTVVVVFLTFVICWIPSITLAVSTLFKDGTKFWLDLRSRNHDAFIAIFFICVQILPPLHSTLNPCIYVLFNNHYRLAFKGFVKRIIGNHDFFKELERRMTYYSTEHHQLQNSVKKLDKEIVKLIRLSNGSVQGNILSNFPETVESTNV